MSLYLANHGGQKKDLTPIKAHIRSRIFSGMEQGNPLDGETLISDSESDVVERGIIVNINCD